MLVKLFLTYETAPFKNLSIITKQNSKIKYSSFILDKQKNFLNRIYKK